MPVTCNRHHPRGVHGVHIRSRTGTRATGDRFIGSHCCNEYFRSPGGRTDTGSPCACGPGRPCSQRGLRCSRFSPGIALMVRPAIESNSPPTAASDTFSPTSPLRTTSGHPRHNFPWTRPSTGVYQQNHGHRGVLPRGFTRSSIAAPSVIAPTGSATAPEAIQLPERLAPASPGSLRAARRATHWKRVMPRTSRQLV